MARSYSKINHRKIQQCHIVPHLPLRPYPRVVCNVELSSTPQFVVMNGAGAVYGRALRHLIELVLALISRLAKLTSLLGRPMKKIVGTIGPLQGIIAALLSLVVGTNSKPY
jgi:hypothetical protein